MPTLAGVALGWETQRRAEGLLTPAQLPFRAVPFPDQLPLPEKEQRGAVAAVCVCPFPPPPEDRGLVLEHGMGCVAGCGGHGPEGTEPEGLCSLPGA